MTIINISKNEVDNVFSEANEQADYILGMYELVLSKIDLSLSDIEAMDQFPGINKQTNHYITEQAVKWDRQHKITTIIGGGWLQNGFSTLEGRDLGDWQVSINKDKLRMKS